MAKVDRSSDMPLRQIDLSDPKYRSDGVPGIPKTVSSHDMTREDNTIFLECLSGAFNKNSRLVAELGSYVKFINEPPHGYASFIRPETYDDGQRVDKFIYGHPSGNSYASCNSFAEHVLSIIKGELDKCACVNCQPAHMPDSRTAGS